MLEPDPAIRPVRTRGPPPAPRGHRGADRWSGRLAILFAPVGDLVPVAMRALDRGGILAVAGLHLTDTPPLNYEHELFYEKEVRSVTSNTRDNGREFLAFALRHHVRATTHVYPMSQAQQALQDLKAGRFDGAAVLVNDQDATQ